MPYAISRRGCGPLDRSGFIVELLGTLDVSLELVADASAIDGRRAAHWKQDQQ